MFKWFMFFIYIVLCGYVLSGAFRWTKWMEFPHRGKVNVGITVGMLLLASTIFFGKFLPEGKIQMGILKFGNYWLGFLIYLIFFVLVCDLIRLVRFLLSFKWKKMKEPWIRSKGGIVFLAILVLGGSGAFTVYGAIHAKQIKTASYEIEVDKDAGQLKDLKVVLIADLHLGYSVGSKDMDQMVEKINEQKPDLVVLAGDIFDNDYDALDDPEHLTDTLQKIRSKYGVYAVFGNHDVKETLVAGFSISPSKNALRDTRMDEFMERAGITMLEDASELIDNSFYLVGRLDGEKNGSGSSERQSIEALTAGMDQTKPILVINHEPDELETYEKNGVDVLLSGHTHAGQFFPLTIVQPFAWENYWGIKQIGSLYSIVTSGVGVYGPDIRVATDSEIMVVNMHFK